MGKLWSAVAPFQKLVGANQASFSRSYSGFHWSVVFGPQSRGFTRLVYQQHTTRKYIRGKSRTMLEKTPRAIQKSANEYCKFGRLTVTVREQEFRHNPQLPGEDCSSSVL